VLVAEPRARQQHRGEAGIVEMDRDAGRDELGLPERASVALETRAQVEPGRACVA